MVIDVKTVYRHPMGRFEVRETTHHAFGNTYVVREAFLTPDEDRRRLPEAMRIRQSAETEDKPKSPFIAVTACEAEGFAELYRDNVSIEEIAHRFHRTPETVRSHLRRLGALKMRKSGFWKVTEIREAQDMMSSGCSRSEIARKLGRTENSIQSCMNSKKWREVEAR